MKLYFNYLYNRWEVYTEKSVIRGGRVQPVFVSKDKDACIEYMRRVRS